MKGKEEEIWVEDIDKGGEQEDQGENRGKSGDLKSKSKLLEEA